MNAFLLTAVFFYVYVHIYYRFRVEKVINDSDTSQMVKTKTTDETESEADGYSNGIKPLSLPFLQRKKINFVYYILRSIKIDAVQNSFESVKDTKDIL